MFSDWVCVGVTDQREDPPDSCTGGWVCRWPSGWHSLGGRPAASCWTCRWQTGTDHGRRWAWCDRRPPSAPPRRPRKQLTQLDWTLSYLPEPNFPVIYVCQTITELTPNRNYKLKPEIQSGHLVGIGLDIDLPQSSLWTASHPVSWWKKCRMSTATWASPNKTGDIKP